MGNVPGQSAGCNPDSRSRDYIEHLLDGRRWVLPSVHFELRFLLVQVEKVAVAVHNELNSNELNWWHNRSQRDVVATGARKLLRRQTRLVSIGSCFARNFARWFEAGGGPNTSPDWGLHYNPITIKDELAAALGHQQQPLIGEFGGDPTQRFRDLRRHEVWNATLAGLNAVRAQLATEATGALATAQALVVTYGLAEVCELEADTGVWFVVNRGLHNCQSHSEKRTRFLTVEEIATHTCEILRIARCVNEVMPVFFTVSPVPLAATYAGCDPRIANARSKATLLVGLHQGLQAAADPGAFYFPAYEMFGPGVDFPCHFQDDGRHPTAEAVARVASAFWAQFGEGELDPIPDFQVPRPKVHLVGQRP